MRSIKFFLLPILLTLLVGCASVPQSAVSAPKTEGEHVHLGPDYVLTKQEKAWFTDMLMVRYGNGALSQYKEEFSKCTTFGDIENFVNARIVDDAHFMLAASCSCKKKTFRIKPLEIRKESKVVSPCSDVFRTETPNAEYVRCASAKDRDVCTKVLQSVKLNKDFIVFDFRGNGGGGIVPWVNFMKQRLSKYKGTIIVMQDKSSQSMGELWWLVGKSEYSNLKRILIGQNSTGCVSFGRGDWFTFGMFQMWVGYDDNRESLKKIPEWKGETVGFEPHIFCNESEDYINAMKNLGVDTTGIEI